MQLIVSISLLILFFAFYIKSLEGCPARPIKIGECLRWLKENGPSLATYGVASAFWYATLIVLIIWKIVSKYWLIPSLISMGIAYCIQGGVGFDDHGFFNRSIVLFAVAAMILVFFVIRGIYYIWRRGKKHILFGKNNSPLVENVVNNNFYNFLVIFKWEKIIRLNYLFFFIRSL